MPNKYKCWTKQEHEIFLTCYDNGAVDYKMLMQRLPTKRAVQIGSHLQKFNMKLNTRFTKGKELIQNELTVKEVALYQENKSMNKCCRNAKPA